MNRVVIVGANEFSKQVISIANNQKKYLIIGYYDDFSKESMYNNLPIFGTLDQLKTDYDSDNFDFIFFAIGYNRLSYKESLMNIFNGIPLATIIHPTAFVETDSIIEEGVLIYPFAYVGPRVHLKKCSVLNVYSYLPHDNIVEECTFLSGGINVGGKVNIGKRCFIGIGVTTNDTLEIGDDIFLGSNTLVTKSIYDKGTYIGSPARKIKDTF
jgi:sugar O-acyltransferase (sialic acid O-acetyltransferase NeuD family)